MAKPDTLPAKIRSEQHELPGFVQSTPPDAISADVRQHLIDLINTHSGWDGVVLYIGDETTHWMQISAEELISCQSFLTPRLIADHKGAAKPDMDILNDTLSHPERLAAKLYRGAITMDGALITGALIGSELAAARPYWLGQEVMIIGTGYLEALKAQSVQVSTFSV